MNLSAFTELAPGELIRISDTGEGEWAFIPLSLPPNWEWPVQLWPLLLEARTALASLNGIGKHLPNPNLLLRPLQYREAARSSSLEGTYTQPQQQLLFQLEPLYPESEKDPTNAYREVYNYERALRYRLESDQNLPLSLRLIRELHRILMDGVRGADKEPGQFRRLQVHLGQPPRFVPPPPHLLMSQLDALEKYFHQPKQFDPLVEAFLVHYQFEAIHPFRDGNGRVGRLLLSIMIAEWCGLSNQWLHMSSYFDDHRDEYIDKLFHVSTHARWQEWIEFCLHGVVLQANDTERRCDRLLQLSQTYKEKLKSIRGSSRLNLIVDELFNVPIVQVAQIARRYEVTYPTARADVDKLLAAGILIEFHDARQKTYYNPEIIQVIYDNI
jgi:Fic family protein